MDEIDEVIKEFLVESYESLDQLDRDVLALEDAPDDLDTLASVFRNVHTIKGTSGFLALPKLERVAHVGENLLVPLRDGTFALDNRIADGLLGMVDAIREILGELENTGSEGEKDYEPLVGQLEKLLSDAQNGVTGGEEATQADEGLDAEAEEGTESSASSDLASEPATADSDATAETAATIEDESATAAESSDAVQKTQETTPAPQAETPAAAPAKKEPTAKPASQSSSSSERGGGSVAGATVRIDVELLDKLMNLVGELVLSRNQIVQFCSESDEPTMLAASQRLNLITTELQEGVMKTRMQPIRNAWSKLPRVVRDLSSACGKKVEVRMEGADTELDKTVLEAIRDPLTHIVRNSVDHGIESPEVREANGKSGTGVLRLSAFHEGGQVNIEITDDGGGINTDRIRAKAIEKGLITEEQCDAMNERELTNLILLPGFSTAQQVTNVSGRGVGMDVVKTNIERIGGTLDIQSTPGQGTTLRIKIPLTLAIVPALIVKSVGQQYAIPQVNLLELVRLDGGRVQDEIEFIHDAPVYRLRGELLPLVYLDEQLSLRPKRQRHDAQETVNIVVLLSENRPFGLVVDAVTDTQEIVVKPLGSHLKNIPAYAGATIMGDGSVSLILDVLGLAQKSKVMGEHRGRGMRDNMMAAHEQLKDKRAVLIVESGDNAQAAIPLSSVARLEEFEISSVEKSGYQQVVQYRDGIMPLMPLSDEFGMQIADGESSCFHTVVYTENEQNVGVVVSKIVDIVYENVNSSEFREKDRCVVRGRVTELIDLPTLVHRKYPEIANAAGA